MILGKGLSAVALTAGLGTRLRPFTETRAKPALPFFGVPLALHALRHLEDLPVRELFLNLHHLPESIRQLDLTCLKLPPVQFSDETSRILGGAGALHHLMPQISQSQILLLNGDEVLLPKNPWALSDIYKDHSRSDRLATLVTMEHPEVGRTLGGIWTDESSRMVKVSKEPQAGLSGHHFTGYVFLHSRIKNYFKTPLQEENILYDTLTRALESQEEVVCSKIEAHWYETGQVTLFMESTRDLLNRLSSGPQDPGLNEFISFLRRARGRELIIENQDPEVRAQLENFFGAVLDRSY